MITQKLLHNIGFCHINSPRYTAGVFTLSFCYITPSVFHASAFTRTKINLNKMLGDGKRPITTSVEKPKVFITRHIPLTAYQILKDECHVEMFDSVSTSISRTTLVESVRGVDAIFCLPTDRIDEEVIKEAGGNLKVVSTMSVGHDHIDLEACKSASVAVGYTPDILTDSVAELTLALVLGTARRFKEGMNAVVSGGWGSWVPLWLCGKQLKDSIVGIVGLGRIGIAIARLLIPFSVKQILYSSRNPSPYAREVHAEYVSFEELLRDSDFVIVSCSLTEQTKHLFNKAAFKKMKNDAIFINVSRGAIVNQTDLYDALINGELYAAGLDVTDPEPLPLDSPLLTIPNCTILPHLGSAVEHTRIKMAELTSLNILAVLNGRKMPCPLYTPILKETLQS